ncbi:MAG: 2-phospho-L-lactate transferase [Candidatus Limnocylindrales bacterium]
MTRVVVLAGGYGGAKLAHGLAIVADGAGPAAAPIELSVVVNTGDDLELHGLLVCPDLDTVMYTLAGLANEATGWGVRDETWSGREMLERYGQETWFALGDRDIATHLLRSKRMRAGARLTEVTAELAGALGIRTRLLPMTDDIVRTKLRTDDGWLSFQDYFVGHHHAPEVHEVHFHGIEHAEPSVEVLEAVAHADRIVIAPSNPFVSIGTILAVPGVLEALMAAPAQIVAVSPLIGGAAVRGPADRMFVSLGGEASALGVARHYADRYPGLLDGLVIDDVDAAQADEVGALGLACRTAPTLMLSDDDRRRLALDVLAFGARLAA